MYGYEFSDASKGWAGWALDHSEFGVSVDPIPIRGVDYAHHVTASPPGFENLDISETSRTMFNVEMSLGFQIQVGKQ
jgi:hypothetical protein